MFISDTGLVSFFFDNLIVGSLVCLLLLSYINMYLYDRKILATIFYDAEAATLVQLLLYCRYRTGYLYGHGTGCLVLYKDRGYLS